MALLGRQLRGETNAYTYQSSVVRHVAVRDLVFEYAGWRVAKVAGDVTVGGIGVGRSPHYQGTTRLAEVAHSESALVRERATWDRRVDRILPDGLIYRAETPDGAVGYRVPETSPSTRRRSPAVSVWSAGREKGVHAGASGVRRANRRNRQSGTMSPTSIRN